MNIVIEIEDKEYLEKLLASIKTPRIHWQDYSFYWGLGDDGHIYYHTNIFGEMSEWRHISGIGGGANFGYLVDAQKIKWLADRFVNYLPFI